MRLLNLREIEELHGVNPLASYNFHKNFPQFEHFLMHPTTMGYNTQKINKMIAEPKYAVGAGEMVGASFLGDLWEGVKGVADVAGPLLPLLVGLGREEAHDVGKYASNTYGEKVHKAHELVENKKLKKVKKLADQMLNANKRMLRAELVRRIMKERKVSMIKASQIIKAENLKY
jgi:hypothetical protein